jgi:hypothetical protein
MTLGKAVAAVLALVAVFALGVWTGPYLTDRSAVADQRAAHDSARAADAEKTEKKARPVRARAARRAGETDERVVAASDPEVQKRLKPVLNRGTNMAMAAEGFSNAEQFAAVAYAARNTKIPFMVLKHRVLNEGKSLADAISESKADADAAAEARRARAEAREHMAALPG